jgi:hypothetical protein
MSRNEQKMFVVEVEIDLGNPFETIELNRSYPSHDAADNFLPDKLSDVLIRAGETLQEMIYDNKFNEDQVMKIVVRELREGE